MREKTPLHQQFLYPATKGLLGGNGSGTERAPGGTPSPALGQDGSADVNAENGAAASAEVRADPPASSEQRAPPVPFIERIIKGIQPARCGGDKPPPDAEEKVLPSHDLNLADGNEQLYKPSGKCVAGWDHREPSDEKWVEASAQASLELARGPWEPIPEYVKGSVAHRASVGRDAPAQAKFRALITTMEIY